MKTPKVPILKREEEIKKALLKPLTSKPMIKDSPSCPPNAQSGFPFQGGETNAKLRLHYLLTSGFLTTYPSTYNGLLDIDSSSKLSAYLALGCITSRQIHASLVVFEDGVSTTELKIGKAPPASEVAKMKGQHSCLPSFFGAITHVNAR
jgi:deoxyribodipyrimidine photolyase